MGFNLGFNGLNKDYNATDITEIIHFISFIKVLSMAESLRKNKGRFFQCASHEGTGGSGIINPLILNFRIIMR